MSFSHQQAPHIVREHLHSTQPKREKPSRRSRNLLIHMSIAPRLVLGFLIPALIAAVVAGSIGIQSAQLLSQESDFYQQLFQQYSALTTGNDFLQLMDFKTQATIADASGTNPPQDLLTTDQQAIQQLATRYETLLRASVQNDLLAQHPDQAALFEQAGHPGQAVQQSLLAHSALRTWSVYRDAQQAVLQDIRQGNDQAAQNLEQLQGEPTFSDALSALRQLIQFDGRLTTYVQDATAFQERNQLITTLVAAVLVLLTIGVIGRLVYGTLVHRLRRLQHVAQVVQKGQITSRVLVDGRDEITAVSVSVNAMLDTIVGLLDETRMQRDALSNAATRLFSDIRLANAVDFDVSAAVNTDPIGMLENAFHFTIGRFRRFVLRMKRTIEPLEFVAQQEIERTTSFLANTRDLVHGLPAESHDPSNTAVTQVQEIARLAEGYAQEGMALAQHLRGITQEMRASLAPFRLEAIERSKGFTTLR